MSKATTAANAILNHHARGTTPAALTPYLGLLTNVEAATEVTGGSYARVQLTTTNFSNAAANKTIANTVALTFPAATAGWGDVIGWAIYDASTAGNIVRSGYLVSGVWRTFTGLAASEILTAIGHTIANTDRVVVVPAVGSTLPTGLTQGTLYYAVGVSGNTLQLSLTLGGAAINITADGGGIIAKVTPQTVNSGNTFSFAIGAFVLNEM